MAEERNGSTVDLQRKLGRL